MCCRVQCSSGGLECLASFLLLDYNGNLHQSCLIVCIVGKFALFLWLKTIKIKQVVAIVTVFLLSAYCLLCDVYEFCLKEINSGDATVMVTSIKMAKEIFPFLIEICQTQKK